MCEINSNFVFLVKRETGVVLILVFSLSLWKTKESAINIFDFCVWWKQNDDIYFFRKIVSLSFYVRVSIFNCSATSVYSCYIWDLNNFKCALFTIYRKKKKIFFRDIQYSELGNKFSTQTTKSVSCILYLIRNN